MLTKNVETYFEKLINNNIENFEEYLSNISDEIIENYEYLSLKEIKKYKKDNIKNEIENKNGNINKINEMLIDHLAMELNGDSFGKNFCDKYRIVLDPSYEREFDLTISKMIYLQFIKNYQLISEQFCKAALNSFKKTAPFDVFGSSP